MNVMTTYESTYIPFSTELALPPRAQSEPDFRWLWTGGLVALLTIIGVAFSFATGSIWYLESFSARASFFFVPTAAIGILLWGWPRSTFSIAAGLYLGYLPLSQSASDTFFIYGAEKEGALTLELLLAIPIIITGLLGPRDDLSLRRPLPAMLKAGWIAILISALISTILALSTTVAFFTFVGQFLAPVLVMLAIYRRTRNIEDFKCTFYGFVIGMLSIMVFSFMRSVEGESYSSTLGPGVGQRHLGLTPTSAVPAIYVLGVALWSARDQAERGKVVRSAIWLVLSAVIVILMWIGGHRAPTAFALLLILYWLPGSLMPLFSKPWAVLVLLLGSAGAVLAARYSLETTTVDVNLIVDRFLELRSEGLTGHNRMEIWSEGIQYWLTSPIWGVGLNNLVAIDVIYGSLHGSVVGVLFDMGILGALAFALLFGTTLFYCGSRCTANLTPTERCYFAGHRATWINLQIFLAVDLPFTSGQPKFHLMMYLVLMFPLLVWIVYTRHVRPPARATLVRSRWSSDPASAAQ